MKRKFLALCASLAAAAALAGCAYPTSAAPGSSESAVVERLGAPDSEFALSDGGKVLVYSETAAREVYWMRFDASGRLTGTEEVLNEAHFALVKPGVSKLNDVLVLFGKPSWSFTLGLLHEKAIIYQFREDSGLPMAFWVQYKDDGTVTDASVVQDPLDNGDSIFPTL